MMSVATSEESERRLAEAMRAHASGAGHAGFAGWPPAPVDHVRPPAAPAPAPGPGPAPRLPAAQPEVPRAAGRSELGAAIAGSRLALLVALLAGVVLGVALALLSLLAPGVLPTLG
jgi:hypothetical protein